MKKVIVLALSAAFLTLSISSCKKTTKRKLSNEWKVVKMSSDFELTYADGSRSSSLSIYSGNSITKTLKDTDPNGSESTTIETGEVSEFTYTIDKDGTWKKSSNFKWVFSDGSSNQQIREDKGTWYFLGKNKGDKFKKNEKVVFYTNESSSKEINIDGSTTATDLFNDTYKGSEDGVIFTVVESKGKKLTLEYSYNTSNTWSGGADSSKDKVVYELEQK